MAADPEFPAAITAAFQAFNERRFDDFAKGVTTDHVEIYPQSGEVLRGRDVQKAFHEAFPNPPTFAIRNILQDGNLAVIETDENYPDGSTWKTVFILELREDGVARMTMYFGEPFAPPEWRKEFFQG